MGNSLHSRSILILFMLLLVGIPFISAFSGELYSQKLIQESSQNTHYYTIYIVPHAHFDPYWLDPWSAEAERFSANIRSMLDMMEADPSYKAVIDQACGLRYFWENNPQYHYLLRKMINEGRIEIVGGGVSQPETNLIGDQDLLHDMREGILWFKRMFNASIKVAWQIDIFGHTMGVASFLNYSDIPYLVIGRAVGIPDGLFVWKGEEGRTILALKAPHYNHDFGESSYSIYLHPENKAEFFRNILNWIDPSTSPTVHNVNPYGGAGDQLLLYGTDFSCVNPALSSYVRAWNTEMAQKYGYVCKIATPSEFFEEQVRQLKEHPEITLPVIEPTEDLNPIFPGYYTTHYLMKLYNRQVETRLQQLETWGLIASQVNLSGSSPLASYSYPEHNLSNFWWKTSLNHHHDALTGTSPQAVYEDFVQNYRDIIPLINSNLKATYSYIMNLIEVSSLFTDEEEKENASLITVFNSLSGNRSGIVEVNVSLNDPFTKNISLIDLSTNLTIPVSFEIFSMKNTSQKYAHLMFYADSVPGIGYKAYLMIESEGEEGIPIDDSFLSPENLPRLSFNKDEGFTLENQAYKLAYNVSSKDVLKIYDKKSQVDILKPSSTRNFEIVIYNDTGDAYFYDLRNVLDSSLNYTPQILLKYNNTIIKEVILSYNFSGILVNRCISLGPYDSLLSLHDDVYIPEEYEYSFSLAARYEFNVEESSYRYTVPFGHVVKSESDLFFPAQYGFSIINTSSSFPLAIHWVNYAIHGYRKLNNSLYEGILVRDLKGDMSLKTEGSGVTMARDFGQFYFSYSFKTFQFPEEEPRISRYELEFNYPLSSSALALSNKEDNGSLLPPHLKFFSVNTTEVIITNIEKINGENSYLINLRNLANRTLSYSLYSHFYAPEARECNGLGESTSFRALYPSEKNEEKGCFDFHASLSSLNRTTLVLDSQKDINAPIVPLVTLDEGWSENPFIILVDFRVSNTLENYEDIDTVMIQYCNITDFLKQPDMLSNGTQWSSIKAEKTEEGVYRAELTVDPSKRPLVFRVWVNDTNGNVATSPSSTLYLSAISDKELSSGLILYLILLWSVGALILFFYKYTMRSIGTEKKMPQKIQRRSLHGMFSNGITYLRRHIRHVYYVVIPAGFFSSVFLYAIIHGGFFGDPPAESVINGFHTFPIWTFPQFPWYMEFNLPLIFAPKYMFISLFAGLVSGVLGVLIGKSLQPVTRYKLVLVLHGFAFAILVPALIVVFLVGQAPALYYTQVFRIYLLIYALTGDLGYFLVIFYGPFLFAFFLSEPLIVIITFLQKKNEKSNQKGDE